MTGIRSKSRWGVYVEAYGDSARACVNAASLYRALIVADRDLRQKVKNLTEIKSSPPPK